MKKKQFCLRAIPILIIFLAVCAFIAFFQAYVFRVNERDPLRLDGFRMEARDSLDVVFLGASEVYTAFSPALAYERYGFTSYDYSVASCPVTYWQIMLDDILKSQSPQLIVVEVNGTAYETPESLSRNSALHFILDGMPLSYSKVQTCRKYCDDYTDPWECFCFPILKYHDNWKSAKEQQTNFENVRLLRNRGFSLLRGISTTTEISPPVEVRDISNDHSERDLSPVAEDSLRSFLQYCRDSELPVLFVRFPHRIPSEEGNRIYLDFQKTNRAGQIIEEYGFDYLDLEHEHDRIGIDPNHDFYNDGHMNIYGQLKMTDYFSRLLVDRYGITPRPQSARQREQWDLSVEYYAAYCEMAEECFDAGLAKTLSETAALVTEMDQRLQSVG